MSYIEYHPFMSEKEVFEAGYDGYVRGWKKIPPAWIALDRPKSDTYRGNASVWMSGWEWAKLMLDNQVPDEV